MTVATSSILFHFAEQHGLDGSRGYDANPAWAIPVRDDRPIGGLEELVRFVVEVCESHRAGISHLNLVCHGKADGIWVGKDWVSYVGAKRWLPPLARLAAFFAPGAAVTVHSVETGTDRRLLDLLRRVWPGTRVEGYLDPYERHVFQRRDEQGKRVCRRRLSGVRTVVDEC
jgi:hypothetical protein